MTTSLGEFLKQYDGNKQGVVRLRVVVHRHIPANAVCDKDNVIEIDTNKSIFSRVSIRRSSIASMLAARVRISPASCNDEDDVNAMCILTFSSVDSRDSAGSFV